jgi:hypothetical protein
VDETITFSPGSFFHGTRADGLVKKSGKGHTNWRTKRKNLRTGKMGKKEDLRRY